MLRFALAIVVLILCIIIYKIGSSRKEMLTSGIGGLWVAEPDFCEDSEIDGMLMHLGDEDDGRGAYLIMYKNNNIVLNHQFNIVAGRPNWGFGPIKCDITIDKPWVGAVENMTMEWDPSSGVMVLYDADTQYFRARRN